MSQPRNQTTAIIECCCCFNLYLQAGFFPFIAPRLHPGLIAVHMAGLMNHRTGQADYAPFTNAIKETVRGHSPCPGPGTYRRNIRPLPLNQSDLVQSAERVRIPRRRPVLQETERFFHPGEKVFRPFDDQPRWHIAMINVEGNSALWPIPRRELHCQSRKQQLSMVNRYCCSRAAMRFVAGIARAPRTDCSERPNSRLSSPRRYGIADQRNNSYQFEIVFGYPFGIVSGRRQQRG